MSIPQLSWTGNGLFDSSSSSSAPGFSELFRELFDWCPVSGLCSLSFLCHSAFLPSFRLSGVWETKVSSETETSASSWAWAAFSVGRQMHELCHDATRASKPARTGRSNALVRTSTVSSSNTSWQVCSDAARTVPGESFAYNRDRASATTFSLPGMYTTSKSKALIFSNHLACCYNFSSVSLTHVFLTSDSRFASFSFHRFNQFRSMFHIHAFYFYMPITCILTHVFHTCYLHVFFYLLITCHASMVYLYINLSVDLAVSLASL